MGAKLKEIECEVKSPEISVPGFTLPSFRLCGKIAIGNDDRRAAWELYVELVTRIAIEELPDNDGILREALASLYALFGETRKILRHYGPDIAIPKRGGTLSIGQLAVDVLNSFLRPILAYWHPELKAYEDIRKPNVSLVEHERRWPRAKEFRKVLRELQAGLTSYAVCLAKAAGIEPIRSCPRYRRGGAISHRAHDGQTP